MPEMYYDVIIHAKAGCTSYRSRRTSFQQLRCSRFPGTMAPATRTKRRSRPRSLTVTPSVDCAVAQSAISSTAEHVMSPFFFIFFPQLRNAPSAHRVVRKLQWSSSSRRDCLGGTRKCEQNERKQRERETSTAITERP